MPYSFKEKSVFALLLALLVAYGFYFVVFLKSVESDLTISQPLLGGLFIAVTVIMVVAIIISQTLLAITHHKEASSGDDERDRLIETKAEARSSIVLGIGAFLASVAGIYQLLPAFLIGNLIFFFLVLSELSKGAVQLYYYRRGV